MVSFQAAICCVAGLTQVVLAKKLRPVARKLQLLVKSKFDFLKHIHLLFNYAHNYANATITCVISSVRA